MTVGWEDASQNLPFWKYFSSVKVERITLTENDQRSTCRRFVSTLAKRCKISLKSNPKAKTLRDVLTSDVEQIRIPIKGNLIHTLSSLLVTPVIANHGKINVSLWKHLYFQWNQVQLKKMLDSHDWQKYHQENDHNHAAPTGYTDWSERRTPWIQCTVETTTPCWLKSFRNLKALKPFTTLAGQKELSWKDPALTLAGVRQFNPR